jgi:hypothetical protein
LYILLYHMVMMMMMMMKYDKIIIISLVVFHGVVVQLLFSFLEVVVRLFLCRSVGRSPFSGMELDGAQTRFGTENMAGRTTFRSHTTHLSPPTNRHFVGWLWHIYIYAFLSNIHSHSHTFIGTHTPSLEPHPSIKKSRWKDMKISFAVSPLLVTQHNLLVPMYRYTMGQPVQPGGMRWTSSLIGLVMDRF